MNLLEQNNENNEDEIGSGNLKIDDSKVNEENRKEEAKEDIELICVIYFLIVVL